MPPDDLIPPFDLYVELGVEFGADRMEIERAWRSAVQAVHPDPVGSDDQAAATARTARLNIARQWLSDPARRARYDELRRPHAPFAMPVVDPMGAWPTPRVERRGLRSTMSHVPVLVAVVAIVLTLLVGVGSNVVTIVAFDLSIVTIVYYGVYVFVGAFLRGSQDR